MLGGVVLARWWNGVLDGVLLPLADAAAHVPADVPVGFHLRHGDVEEAHSVRPADARLLASVVHGVLARGPRTIAHRDVPPLVLHRDILEAARRV